MKYGMNYKDLEDIRLKIKKQGDWLKSNTFVSEESGVIKSMLDISYSPNHNDRYYSRILNKVNTFVSVNTYEDLEPIFLTITLDGFFRDFKKGDYSRWDNTTKEIYKKHIPNNDRFGYYRDRIDNKETLTNKDLYKILMYQWHRFTRSFTLQNLKNNNDRYTFMRVSEPHKDGTPHFHVLFYIKKEYHVSLKREFEKFFPAPQNHKKIFNRDVNKIGNDYETQGFQTKLFSPAGYILKYILKSFSDLREQKEIDYLQAWYISNKIPRIITSHTLASQKSYHYASILEPDWYYLTNIKLNGNFTQNIYKNYFKFDDGHNRILEYDDGLITLRNHNKLVGSYGKKKFSIPKIYIKQEFKFTIEAPKDFQPLKPYIILYPKKYKFIVRLKDNETYNISVLKEDKVIINSDDYQFDFENNTFKVRINHYKSSSIIIPAQMSNFKLFQLYYNFDFDLHNPKLYVTIHKELIIRGLIDDLDIDYDDYNTDFNCEMFDNIE